MIDAVHQINERDRRVGTRVLEAGEAHTMTISQTYDTDVDDLWDACTNPERLPRWFLPVSGELRLHGHYQIEGNASGTIQQCDPPNGFAATWEYGGDVSWIEVRLTAQPGGRARLELEHIAKVDDENWAQYGPGATGVGWDLAFVGLAIHMTTGQAGDPRKVEAWSASADGKQFMTMSSDRWCDANIASGTDKGQAQAAADRTIAAYTATETTP